MQLTKEFTELLSRLDGETGQDFEYPKHMGELNKILKEKKGGYSPEEFEYIEFELKLLGGGLWKDIMEKRFGDSLEHWWSGGTKILEYAKYRLGSPNHLNKGRYAYYLWCKTKDHKLGLLAAEELRKAALVHQKLEQEFENQEQIIFGYRMAERTYKYLKNRKEALDSSKELFDILREEYDEQEVGGFFLAKIEVLIKLLVVSDKGSVGRKQVAQNAYGLLSKCAEIHAKEGREDLARRCMKFQVALLDVGAVGKTKEEFARETILSIEAEGDKFGAEEGQRQMIAKSFYEDALRYLCSSEIKWGDKKDSLQKKITVIEEKINREPQKFFKMVRTPVNIPNEKIETLLPYFAEMDFADAIDRFLENDFLPDMASIKNNVSDEPTLVSILPRTTLGSGMVIPGKTAGLFPPEKMFLLDVQMREIMLIDKISEMPAFNKEFVRSVLEGSKTFSQENMDIITEGVDDFFDGRYCSSAHILVLRVEPCLREISQEIGMIPKKVPRGSNVISTAQLGALLSEPIIQKVLGEDFTHYLLLKFSSPEFGGMRNRIGHGYAKKEELHRTLCASSLMALIKLAKLKVPTDGSTGEKHEMPPKEDRKE